MSRKNIYLAEPTEALLAAIADRYHGGNTSAAIAAMAAAYVERGALIRQAVLDLAAAVEPEEPTQRLSALIDAQAAAAIGEALAELAAA